MQAATSEKSRTKKLLNQTACFQIHPLGKSCLSQWEGMSRGEGQKCPGRQNTETEGIGGLGFHLTTPTTNISCLKYVLIFRSRNCTFGNMSKENHQGYKQLCIKIFVLILEQERKNNRKGIVCLLKYFISAFNNMKRHSCCNGEFLKGNTIVLQHNPNFF